MIDMDIDVKDAARSFKMLLNKRQRKNAMIAVRKAGAAVVKKKAVASDVYGKGPNRKKRDPRFKLRTASKDRKAVHKTKKGWISYRVMAGHAYNVEYGHGASKKPKYLGRGGPAAPHPFIKDAVKAAAPEALRKMTDKFIERVRATLAKSRRG